MNYAAKEAAERLLRAPGDPAQFNVVGYAVSGAGRDPSYLVALSLDG